MQFITRVTVLSVLMATSLLIGGCSKDDTVPSDATEFRVEASTVKIRFQDEGQQRIEGDITVRISRVRPDVNLLVTRDELTTSTSEIDYKIYTDTKVRISVLKKGYNPTYQDVTLKPDTKEVSITLTPKTGLTVLSYNVKDGFGWKNKANLDNFVDWVTMVDPDVIVFQELVGFKQADLVNLAKRYGHDFSVLLKESGYPTGITSKEPITNIERVFITSNTPQFRVHGYIRAETFDTDIFAVHFSSQSNNLVLQEATHVLEAAKNSTNERVIIAGDYNSISPVDEQMLGNKFWTSSMKKYRPSRVPFDYRTMDLFEKSDFQDAVKLNDNSHYRASFPAKTDYISSDFLGFRLDYVYLSKVLSAQCDYAELVQDQYTNKASDHYPYLLHFDVK